MGPMLLRLSVFALALSLPLSASADVVGPDDPSVVCPAGSQRTTHHCGTVCMPRACASDADCFGAGEVCRPVRLCVADELYCGGGGGTYERVHGDCASPCSAGACRDLTGCVVPGTGVDAGSGRDAGPTTVPDSGGPVDAGDARVVRYGCGCSAAGRRGSRGALLLALALLGLALRSRRR